MAKMERFNQEHYSRLVDLIYQSAFDLGRRPVFLRALASSFASHSAIFLNAELSPSPIEKVESIGLDLALMDQWQGCKEHVDLWFQPVCSLGTSHAAIYSSLIPPRRLRTSGFYADYCKPLDIEYGLGGVAEINLFRRSILAVFRSRAGGDFSDSKLQILESLLPHIQRAQELSRLLSADQQVVSGLAQLQQIATAGIVILDRNGYAIFSNGEADRIFVNDDAVFMRNKQICFRDRSTQKKFDLMVAKIASMPDFSCEDFHPILAHRESGKRSYHLLVYPYRVGFPALDSFRETTTIVTLFDPERSWKLVQKRLQAFYELTPSEAKFCAILFETCSLKDAAISVGISRNTAKTHLRNIFEKTGTSSQIQLVKNLAVSISHF